MKTVTHEEAIKGYYEQVKHKYPDISYEDFRVICRTPFDFIKQMIKSCTLPVIMVKYLGKFVPAPSRVKSQLKFEERTFNLGIITEEEYQFRKNYLENYLRDIKDECNVKIIDDTEG